MTTKRFKIVLNNRLYKAAKQLYDELCKMMTEHDYFDTPHTWEETQVFINTQLINIRDLDNENDELRAKLMVYMYVCSEFSEYISNNKKDEQFWLFRFDTIYNIIYKKLYSIKRFEKWMRRHPIKICGDSDVIKYTDFIGGLYANNM